MDGTIQSITALNTLTNEQIIVTGKQYIDCSGDGWLGYHAGAKYHIGREANWQFGEEFAPEVPDTQTMSGCNMLGATRGIPLFTELDHEVPFVLPEWAPLFPAGKAYGRHVTGVSFQWWLEAPNTYDDIYDAEMARDELFRILIGHFNYLKNLWDEKEKAKNYVFSCMPYYDAKRESRRFVGDYMLTQQDCTSGRNFEDAVSHTGWPIDLHNPKGIYSGMDGAYFSNSPVNLPKVPLRSLYSVNINNLFFAGRCASVSHVALGTCRIENTIACEGQAVGTAAALCAKDGINPRDLYRTKLQEFRQILLKDDQYIPGLISTDEKDIARKATVTASSVKAGEEYCEIVGYLTEGFELDRQRRCGFTRGVDKYLDKVWTKLTNKTDEEKTVKFHLQLLADPYGIHTYDPNQIYTVVVPPHSSDWHEIQIGVDTTNENVTLWAEKCPGVWWCGLEEPAICYNRGEREDESQPFVGGAYASHAVMVKEPNIQTANCAAENIINGYSRAKDHIDYEWVSDPNQGLPQWIELKLDHQQPINTIHVTLDTDMTNPSMLRLYEPFPSKLVKAYTVEVHDGEKWIQVGSVEDNWYRRIDHKFDTINATAVRINVTQSGDGVTARIFEVRIYNV